MASVQQALAANRQIVDAYVDGERRITLPEILREEAELMRHVREGRGRVAPLNMDALLGAYQFKFPFLKADTKENAQQRKAVMHVLGSQDWIVGIVGRAGTGKTTLLHEIAAGVEAAGRRLIVCAPTAEASRGVLRAEGFSSAETIKRLLVDPALHGQLRGNVLWIDEAGMVGNRDMLALIRLAKEHGAARVVLSGDPSQIRSVVRGDAFLFLEKNAGLRVARLEEIRRQKTPELRLAIEAISRGEITQAFSILERSGSIIEGDPETNYRKLAESYADKIEERSTDRRYKTALVVSPTHREGEEITDAIRSELRKRDVLGSEERTFKRTANLSWTKEQRQNAASYEPGLLVQFKAHAPGFRASERVRVVDVNAREEQVMVRTNAGTTTELPLKHASRFQVYAVKDLAVSAGDRLRITENARDASGQHRLNNGDLVRVAGFSPVGEIKLTNGRTLPRDFGHYNHGYVITADAAQSKTVDAVFAAVGQDSLSTTDLRRVYVMLSRAREEARIYTEDKNELRAAAQRETTRRSATELIGETRSQEILRTIRVHTATRVVPLLGMCRTRTEPLQIPAPITQAQPTVTRAPITQATATPVQARAY